MITLKRFDFHTGSAHTNQAYGHGQNHSYNEKIDTFIDFPINSFDVTSYLSRNRRSRCRSFSNMSVHDIIGRTKYTSDGGQTDAVDGTETQSNNTTSTNTDNINANANTNTTNTHNTPDMSMYDLFAVCNHIGRSGYGHYTAMARDWRYPDTSNSNNSNSSNSGVNLDNEPDLAFGPWYEYDGKCMCVL